VIPWVSYYTVLIYGSGTGTTHGGYGVHGYGAVWENLNCRLPILNPMDVSSEIQIH